MHGKKRDEVKNLTPEQIEEQRRTTEKWQQLWEKMLALRKERAFTFEALVLTQQLIELNPDCYTPWNYRKQILSSKLSMKSRVEPEPTPVESIEQAITENTESPGENKQDEVPKEEGAEIPNSDAVKDEPKEVQPTVEDEEEKKRKQQELEEQAKIKEIEQEKLEKEAQEKELKELEETITLRQKKELIRKDLTEITIRAIRHNHKSYNVWYHRRWIMLQMKKLSEAIHAGEEVKHSSDTLSDDVDWKCDLDLTTQFLKLDSRNFHCWGYRKFIVQESNVPAEKELEYTEAKIGEGGKFFSDGGGKAAQECSFSNYSAWHLRSILLTQQIESIKKSETEAPEQQIKELLDTEFEFLAQVVATHNGQSPWLYHRWLVGRVEDPEHKRETLHREINLCEEIIKIDTELSPNDPSPKWATLTKAFLLQGLKDLGESVDDGEITSLLGSLVQNDPDHKNFYDHLKHKASVKI